MGTEYSHVDINEKYELFRLRVKTGSLAFSDIILEA